MIALLSCSVCVDIVEISQYVLYGVKINDEDNGPCCLN